MKKNVLLAIIVSVSLVFGLYSCGGGEKCSKDETTEAEATTTQESTEETTREELQDTVDVKQVVEEETEELYNEDGEFDQSKLEDMMKD